MLPQPGHYFSVLHMLDDRLTIFGGRDTATDDIINKVTTYNNDTNKWYSHYPDMLHKRMKPGVITYHNYVIVMGGKSSPDTTHDSIEVMEYHDLLQWKEVSIHLPVPMWGIKPTISGNHIIIVGYNATRSRRSHYQITIDEITSSLDQPLSTGTKWKKMLHATHYGTVTVPYSNPPLIIGGRIHPIYTSDISLYDASKNSWRKVDSLTSARSGVGVALINDHSMIVIGGSTSGKGVEAAEASSVTTVEIGNIVVNH